MFRTNAAGATLAAQSTPAWWIVTYFGVCLRASGIGCGFEPHSAAETIAGRGTAGASGTSAAGPGDARSATMAATIGGFMASLPLGTGSRGGTKELAWPRHPA